MSLYLGAGRRYASDRIPDATPSHFLSFFWIAKKKMTRILEATQSSSEASKRAVCALEEVDTPSDEDRGFLAAIAEVLKTTKRPIVLTCNDPAKVPPQVLDLVDALEFRQPTLLELFVHCALVLVAEQRQCGWADLLTWLEGDLRA